MTRFEVKIVGALLLIAVIPLVASVILVGQVIRVSDGVAEGESQRLREPLRRAANAYRSLFSERKRAFKLHAQLIAKDRALRAALVTEDRGALEGRIAHFLKTAPGLGVIEVFDGGQRRVLRRKRQKPYSLATHRDLPVEQSVEGSGASIRMTFYTPRSSFSDFRELDRAQRTTAAVASLRSDLGSIYRVAFLIIFGAVLVVATGVGIFLARRTTRQVAILARATREVAEGDLQTQVKVKGRDELGELAGAFNEMVKQLRENRERIGYLEKIGAWQEIARRLAHEIKNPLTPIQLAVQQLQKKYEGDDERFSKLLDDACDIITEEIDGLRRLVQAFSSFARLPEVQPEPVDLNALIDDFFKSHIELEQQAKAIDWQGLQPPVDVMVDRMMIKHVLFNIIENAIQAAVETEGDAQGLCIEISAKRLPRQLVELQIKDDGPGMSSDVAARIFDPYYTTKSQGTGLGLAIVKKIILEHRGSISVTSAPKQGATFSITLPVVEPGPHESAIRTTLSRLLGVERG